ncbi:hypothetical protein [Zobellia uliginosa]|uniref:hypothetical protein n=1 Tax=Zobellia uliginosa TaxID=143224 RepID=UPI001C06B7A8|nr:hypothetical protein [Zobellia uliginosa]MBU2948056.1 hypothetical protein [Zobellia uliginosa]
MKESKVNTELSNLYNKFLIDFERIKNNISDDKLNGPFLCSPNQNYINAKTKILVVGQETKGWPNLEKGIDGLMATYEEFNLGINYTRSPFWQFMRKLEKVYGLQNYSCAWTNLNKYDVGEQRPLGANEKEIATVDKLLISEIEILKPDVCLFLLGPDFDFRMKKTFKGLEFQFIDGFKQRQFSKLSHPSLPLKSYRTYHPKYLRLAKLEDKTLDVFEL